MELSRKEYPAMLDRLQPNEAAAKFRTRVQTIGKINSEFADFVQERRKIEEEYAAKLKKLVRKPLPLQDGSNARDLGVWEGPWKKILTSTEDIALSHQTFAHQLEKEVEMKLRSYVSTSHEFSGINTIQGNLTSIAKELEDAQEKSAKLSKKGGKASAAKADAAAKTLSYASTSWEAQAPFMFEKLQLLDETRLNHLRDVFTQYETFHTDLNERGAKNVQQILDVILEIKTEEEISSWARANISGKSITERSARQLSTAGSGSTAPPPAASITPSSPAPRSTNTENTLDRERSSENSNRLEPPAESRSGVRRFGTMFGRRRQSIHGSGFTRAPSPTKAEGRFPGISGFTRTSSRDGRPSPSPRNSSNNLRGSPAPDNRLSSLVESPTSPVHTNGVSPPAMISESLPETNISNGTDRGASPDLSDVKAPPGPPPSHLNPNNQTDSEGYTVPGGMNDPISQAQLEAQDGEQPQFKLDIRKEPIPEQDADAAAALSAVTNTLRSSQAITPNRKVGTIRGRRDVRNTIYAPSGSLDVGATTEYPPPPSPTATPAAIAMTRAATLSSLSGHVPPSASDTASIRSGHSLSNNAVARHHEMHGPGLNASIIETLNATFEAGEIKTANISGEIALVFNHTGSDEPSNTANETIRINNIGNLESIAPNPTFMNSISPDSDEYTFNLSTISAKSASAFTYRVHIDQDNLISHCPILLKTAWKPQGDKLGLIVEYSLNPAFSQETILHNLIILAISTGAHSIGCQTKPTGTQYKEKSLVVWRLGDVTLTTESKRIVCRLNGVTGAVPEPGHVEAKWEVSNASASGISISRFEGKGKEKEAEINVDDPFADADATPPKSDGGSGKWMEVETNKKLVGGKYEAR